MIGAFIVGVFVGITANPSAKSSGSAATVTVTVPADGASAPGESPPPTPAGPVTTMGAGVYQVGVDVQAGQYKTPGPEAGGSLGCYWARLKNDSGGFDAILANGNLEGPGSVTIADGEFVELAGDCTWTKVG